MMRKPGRTRRLLLWFWCGWVRAAPTLYSLSVPQSRQRHACASVRERGRSSGSARNGLLAPPTQAEGRARSLGRTCT